MKARILSIFLVLVVFFSMSLAFAPRVAAATTYNYEMVLDYPWPGDRCAVVIWASWEEEGGEIVGLYFWDGYD